MKPCLYLTSVMHRREGDYPYRFSYPVFSLLLDIDRLTETARRSRLLRIGRWGVVSFRPADHGDRSGTGLRDWAEGLAHAAGVELCGGRIFLLCFPRVFGFGFSPISIWYCEHADGTVRAVIAEVRNTFGEKHAYVMHDEGRAMPWPVRMAAQKRFHVSPFIGGDCRYEFRLGEPAQTLAVAIRQFDRGRLRLTATQVGRALPLTDLGLLRAVIRTPLMALKVMAAIHWHAFRLWLRGAPIYTKPASPKQEVTIHGID